MRDTLTILLVLGAGAALVYVFRKQLGITGAVDAVTNTVYSAATGQVSSTEAQQRAADTKASVLQAGGSAAEAQSAYEQVLREIALRQPLITASWWGLTIHAQQPEIQVPGTGHTIYELRSLGYSDSDIVQMWDYWLELQHEEAASLGFGVAP